MHEDMSTNTDVPFGDHLNRVYRQVAEKDDQCVVVLERTYLESARTLWKALTDPEQLAGWFGPIEGDLRNGGEFTLTETGVQGKITLCDHLRSIILDWETNGTPSQVSIAMPAEREGTILTLRHTMDHTTHWDQYGPAAVGVGWDGALVNLGLFLAGDDRAHPEQARKFASSKEGKDFMKASARLWKEAHTAAGAEDALAEQAARRTAEFYTNPQ